MNTSFKAGGGVCQLSAGYSRTCLYKFYKKQSNYKSYLHLPLYLGGGNVGLYNRIEVKLAAAHPAVELRGMLRAAALVVLVCRTVPKHVAL